MGNIKLNEFKYLASVSIAINVLLFRVSVTVGSRRSLPIVRYREIFDSKYIQFVKFKLPIQRCKPEKVCSTCENLDKQPKNEEWFWWELRQKIIVLDYSIVQVSSLCLQNFELSFFSIK